MADDPDVLPAHEGETQTESREAENQKGDGAHIQAENVESIEKAFQKANLGIVLQLLPHDGDNRGREVALAVTRGQERLAVKLFRATSLAAALEELMRVVEEVKPKLVPAKAPVSGAKPATTPPAPEPTQEQKPLKPYQPPQNIPAAQASFFDLLEEEDSKL